VVLVSAGRLQPPALAQRNQNHGCCFGGKGWLTAAGCATGAQSEGEPARPAKAKRQNQALKQ